MTHTQRFVLLLGAMLLAGILIIKSSPAQSSQSKVPQTLVARQFIAQGAGDQRAVLDSEGLEVTGQQGTITIKSSGRFTEMSMTPRSGGSGITMQMDGREASVPSLSVEGNQPRQTVTITVTGNGPKITLYGSKGKKPRVISP